jgi:hypothetical protein
VADWITITGVKPYDGRYELDIDAQPLTVREWGWIKKHAGYLPLTIDVDAFTDPELITVLAVVAARRAGRVEPADIPALIERFQDVDPFSTITYEAGIEDSDADGPPAPSSEPRRSSNGDSSKTGSASLDDPLSPTGLPRSDTSASDPAMSAN